MNKFITFMSRETSRACRISPTPYAYARAANNPHLFDGRTGPGTLQRYLAEWKFLKSASYRLLYSSQGQQFFSSSHPRNASISPAPRSPAAPFCHRPS